MLFVLALLAIFSCHASQKQSIEHKLSRSEALQLAVSVANQECKQQFSTSPFDTSSFDIRFNDGLWRWGDVDPHGVDGYSAIVSFDAWGDSRSVEVFLSVDYPRMQTRSPRQKDEE